MYTYTKLAERFCHFNSWHLQEYRSHITAAVFCNSVLAIDEQSKSILREQH